MCCVLWKMCAAGFGARSVLTARLSVAPRRRNGSGGGSARMRTMRRIERRRWWRGKRRRRRRQRRQQLLRRLRRLLRSASGSRRKARLALRSVPCPACRSRNTYRLAITAHLIAEDTPHSAPLQPHLQRPWRPTIVPQARSPQPCSQLRTGLPLVISRLVRSHASARTSPLCTCRRPS